MKKLSSQTKLFILIALLFGTASAVQELSRLDRDNLWLLAGLTALACVTQIIKFEGATSLSSYNLSWTIYGFALVFLGAPETMFVILVSHLVEWAWYQYPWYIQAFNIATYALVAHLSGSIIHWAALEQTHLPFLSTLGFWTALALFTLLNHLMVGLVIKFARGESFAQSGVFSVLTLMIDFSLLCLGAAAAFIWRINPFASILTIVPLYLIYSTLKVPALQRKTEIDPKTGLFNSSHLANALRQELARAQRFGRPLTLVMCDLDLLRNINNTYGHLAGDIVLVNTAKILQSLVREYDIVARFGGEEFCILMPETTAEEAQPRIEQLRAAVQAADFEVSTNATPIKATMSFGIADRRGEQQSAEAILHAADLAVYQAKLAGRNRVCRFEGGEVENVFMLRPEIARIEGLSSWEST